MAIKIFDNLTIGQHRALLRNELSLTGLSVDEKTELGFEIWTAFYRENIHRFIEDYFGFKGLKTFQKILLYQMAKNNQFVYAAARGAKSCAVDSGNIINY